MGRPVHYSSEVPQRCQALIDMLAARVDEASDPDGLWGGPLKTTFLLAMATPMVVLPMERIFKPADGNAGVADDTALDPRLRDEVWSVLGDEATFAAAPFFREGAWRYVASAVPFEVGRDWPGTRLEALASDAALAAAAGAKARTILTTLRNALAHGGVTYLDAEGGHTFFATNRLGFASRYGSGVGTRFRLLSISVADFKAFLQGWADWLKESGVDGVLEGSGPGHFDIAAE